MQAGSAAGLRSTINVTPLVDVVLVLLIIFMVMAPQLQLGPEVTLPETERPRDAARDGRQIVITLAPGGVFWIGDARVDGDAFSQRLRELAGEATDWKVLVKGDARLTYGEVKRAMLVVEQAGIHNVGLITEVRAGAD